MDGGTVLNTEFVFVAESGTLEQQSLLLCESLRTFGGRYAGAGITILQPRREKAVSAGGRRRFEAFQARIVEMSIVSPCPEYGPSYRVLALAEYEQTARAECLVYMDSDTLLLSEPDLELQDADVALRPVDVKGMCTSGDADPADVYWRNFCRVCNVDYDQIPFVMSTVEGARVKASYNGGLTVVKTNAGLFAKTAEFFLKSIHENLIPWPDQKNSFPTGHGTVNAKGGRYWGSSQASLSLAITALGLRVKILPPSVNFPLHSYRELRQKIENGKVTVISHVHYHHLFRGDPLHNPILAGQPGFLPESAAWLKERLAKGNAAKRLMVVLGMHRSGTSVLTKGLEALGVDLGSEFHAPAPDNPKGYWEDTGFHGLNEDLLKALDHPWDAPAPLERESVLALCRGDFLSRAQTLVRECVDRNEITGIKDPRFSLLLPFWKKVFKEAGVSVSYVVSFRNPLSVAGSLARRDGASKAKAIGLWTLHNTCILAETTKDSRAVVDYDALMDNPAGQLTRISRILRLAVNPAALAAYTAEFLDPMLRHTRFSAGDIRIDSEYDPAVLALYETLRLEAMTSSPSDPVQRGKIKANGPWRIATLFRFIQKFSRGSR